MRDEYEIMLIRTMLLLEKQIRRKGNRHFGLGEDLCQQLWLKLLDKRPSLASPTEQILRIASNLGRDMERHEELRRHAPLQDDFDARSIEWNTLSNLVDHEDEDRLKEAICRLDPKLSETITALLECDETDRETAERLGISINILRKRRRAAKRRLARELVALDQQSERHRRRCRA